MIESQYEWQLTETPDNEVAIDSLSPVVKKILAQKGLFSEAEIKDFLSPSEANFYDPFLLHDMNKALERIYQAVENNEQITVYGDYDADGITSTTIMYETLSQLGANVNYYIPNRFKEGYGPNQEAFERIIQAGTTLMITVDNGVSGNGAIDRANELNCDVIVTDHHELPETLPNAYAIVHPRIKNDDQDQYPFGYLSGAGVALKVAQAIFDEVPIDLLDVATIGTVADVVSLTDENRALVKAGIEAIKNTQRMGLLELIRVAKEDLATLDEQTIGFSLAPRLNSLGRIDDANAGVELLTTFDENEAARLAQFADDQNTKRKDLVAAVFKKAEAKVQATPALLEAPVLVVVGSNWHEGILGIVANKLVECFKRPAIVLSQADDGQTLKGSGRSVADFDLFKAINPLKEQLVGFGGHHSAIGISLTTAQVSQLQEQLATAAKEQQLMLGKKQPLAISQMIRISQLNFELLDELKLLGPFGQDNPAPVFEFQYEQLQAAKLIGQDKTHLKFKLQDKDKDIEALAFGRGAVVGELNNQTAIVGELGINNFRGRTTMQIMVTDMQSSTAEVSDDSQPLADSDNNQVIFTDSRTAKLTKSMFTQAATYVFFNEKLFRQVEKYLLPESQKIVYGQTPLPKMTNQSVVIVDLPSQLADLQAVFQMLNKCNVTLYLFEKTRISQNGMPNRQQYAKLFMDVKRFSDSTIEEMVVKLMSQTKLAKEVVIHMLQVFIELDFIRINNRLVVINPQTTKKQLQTAPSYQKRLRQLEIEKQLLDVDQATFLQTLRGLCN